MGAKFSKTVKGEKSLDCAVDESSDTFDKTCTLPATFKKKDEEVNKAGTLPRGGLDRSTSFSKRFRKSMTRFVGHKKVSDDAKPVIEAVPGKIVKEENNSEEKDNLKEEIETKKKDEDDLKTAQKKARAQFFENMYSSGEPVNIPKPPISNLPSEMEKVIEEDDIETVSVSLIGTPVVKLIDKHEEESGTQQESAKVKTDAAAAVEEVADLIVPTKQEMVTSESKLTEVHGEVNDHSEVQLVNGNAEETTTAKSLDEKIAKLTTEKLETNDERNVTCSVDEGSIVDDMAEEVALEQKVEHTEEIEHEGKPDDTETLSTVEGVNSKNVTGNDEQPKGKESCSELIQEDEKSDLVIEAGVIQDICTEETTSKEFDGNMYEGNSEEEENLGTADLTTPVKGNITESIELDQEEKDTIKDTANGNEIVTNDDMEGSGASSLDVKCDSRTDDLSSEGGITTDEGIEGSEDEEKEEIEKPKKQIVETIEPTLLPTSQ